MPAWTQMCSKVCILLADIGSQLDCLDLFYLLDLCYLLLIGGMEMLNEAWKRKTVYHLRSRRRVDQSALNKMGFKLSYWPTRLPILRQQVPSCSNIQN